MSEYQLRGFVLPCDVRPTFLIPYFGLRSSNAIFAQDLSADHTVARFMPFDPSPFSDFMGPVPVVERAVGMAGVLACVDRNDRLIVGSADEIKRELARVEFDASGDDAFFATEVMELRGDRAGLARAIDTAASQFASSERGSRWHAREVAMVVGQPKEREGPLPDTGLSIDALRQALFDADWPDRFIAAWPIYERKDRLLDLAVAWIERVSLETPIAAKLFSFLLQNAKRRTLDPQLSSVEFLVLDAAERWLHRFVPTTTGWVPLWTRLMQHKAVIKTRTADLGMEVLRSDLGADISHGARRARQDWLSIWRRLWTLDIEDREELVALLQPRVEQFRMLSGFEKVLLPLLDVSAHQAWAGSVLIDWLAVASRSTAVWARTCNALLKRLGGEERRLIDLAMGWLDQEGLKLSAWYDVWRTLYAFVPSNRLDQLGHDWLVRSPFVMRIWPSVLADLARRDQLRSSPGIVAQAERWLSLNREHADRKMIQDFVSSESSLAATTTAAIVVPRRRIYLIYNHERDAWRVNQVRDRLARAYDIDSPSHDLATWSELRRAGDKAISAFLDAQMKIASVAIVLFGEDTAHRRWVDYEILLGQGLRLGLLAIDISGLRDRDGTVAKSGANPLSQWQAKIDGEQALLSARYPSYDWIADHGEANVDRWIEIAAFDADSRRKRDAMLDAVNR